MKSRRLFARACAVLFACFIGSFASAQTAGTALVRHAPAINSGTVDGSVQQMLAESITLNGGAGRAGLRAQILRTKSRLKMGPFFGHAMQRNRTRCLKSPP